MKGFQRISALAARINKLGVELSDGQLLRQILLDNQELILELNRDQLNDQGVNSKGEEIFSYAPYSPYTIKRKQRKGQPTDRVTLRDTGKFQAGFKLVVTPGSYRVTSDDKKTSLLVEKYGPYIFGLTSENRDKLITDRILPAIFEQIQNSIQDV